MGISDFFHKIRIGFVRKSENALSYVPEEKRYGNSGETQVVCALQSLLPSCKIKKNVLIQTAEGNAEIDCLVLYKNKLFAIEIKNWKGRIDEYNGTYIKTKTDRWTGEIHSKEVKMPFGQLRRAIYLLRKQIPGKVWVNGIVYFEDTQVHISSEDVWFDKMDSLVEYIQRSGKPSEPKAAIEFFRRCIPADYLRARARGNDLHCFVLPKSLYFRLPDKSITRDNIVEIHIEHHWSYDVLHFLLKDGGTLALRLENAKILVNDNGHLCEYGLSKLDYIKLGDTIYGNT